MPESEITIRLQNGKIIERPDYWSSIKLTSAQALVQGNEIKSHSDLIEFQKEEFEKVKALKIFIQDHLEFNPNISLLGFIKKIILSSQFDECSDQFIHDLKQFSELYDQGANFSLIEGTRLFRAVNLWVREWKKKDGHCHVSDGIPGHIVYEILNDGDLTYGNSLVNKLIDSNGEFDPIADCKLSGNDTELKKVFDPEIINIAFNASIAGYFAEGIQELNGLRFNPYGWTDRNLPHNERLNQMTQILDIAHSAAIFQEKEFKRRTGDPYNVQFVFSLNRSKYGKDPQTIVDIIDKLIQIRKSYAPRNIQSRMLGIDICGPELGEEYVKLDGSLSKAGEDLFDALKRAEEADFEIMAHLGDFRNLAKNPKLENIKDEELRIALTQNSLLKEIFSYILNSPLTRIGHGTALQKLQSRISTDKISPEAKAAFEKTNLTLKCVSDLLNGKISPESLSLAWEIDPGRNLNVNKRDTWSQSRAERIYKVLKRLNYVYSESGEVLDVPSDSKILQDFLEEVNPHGKPKYMIDLFEAQMIQNLLSSASKARSIVVERALYEDPGPLNKFREWCPLFKVARQLGGLERIKLITDGFYKNLFVSGKETLMQKLGWEPYGDNVDNHKTHYGTLSSWIATLMLGSKSELTVRQVMELVCTDDYSRIQMQRSRQRILEIMSGDEPVRSSWFRLSPLELKAMGIHPQAQRSRKPATVALRIQLTQQEELIGKYAKRRAREERGLTSIQEN
ncbi:MAG: hypothetical protein SFT81_02055 [Candidatus Caenarcaniphilales bacterium]|nr:hypothetical protein [Candidatus Caenarcaniphilales bacterium]